jgi:hypothetical protein
MTVEPGQPCLSLPRVAFGLRHGEIGNASNNRVEPAIRRRVTSHTAVESWTAHNADIVTPGRPACPHPWREAAPCGLRPATISRVTAYRRLP